MIQKWAIHNFTTAGPTTRALASLQPALKPKVKLAQGQPCPAVQPSAAVGECFPSNHSQFAQRVFHSVHRNAERLTIRLRRGFYAHPPPSAFRLADFRMCCAACGAILAFQKPRFFSPTTGRAHYSAGVSHERSHAGVSRTTGRAESRSDPEAVCTETGVSGARSHADKRRHGLSLHPELSRHSRRSQVRLDEVRRLLRMPTDR